MLPIRPFDRSCFRFGRMMQSTEWVGNSPKTAGFQSFSLKLLLPLIEAKGPSTECTPIRPNELQFGNNNNFEDLLRVGIGFSDQMEVGFGWISMVSSILASFRHQGAFELSVDSRKISICVPKSQTHGSWPHCLRNT